ncbi:MAG: prolipoprotein diacylglyceryl transferase [Candidatus Omnitrophota bacterium]|nr:prolipoprotein diacylglyceryl transferase [Candidatus Omnitrophota bacterium]
MHPILFTLGPITIYTYGVCVFLGVVAGYGISLVMAKKAGIDTRAMADIIFWTIVVSFLGARVTYILVEFKAFLLDPVEILFSRSGFVFYGGLIFGLPGLYFFTKKHTLNFWKVADCLSLAIPVAHAFGRVGCFFYGCCYGRVTTSLVGIIFPEGSPAYCAGSRVIPTQLIEAASLILIFIVLMLARNILRVSGQLFLLYLALYAVVRFVIEIFRADSRGAIGFLSTSQAISILVLIFACIAARFLDYRQK